MEQATTGSQNPGSAHNTNALKGKGMADQTAQEILKASVTPIGNGWFRHTIIQKLGARDKSAQADPTKVKAVPLTFAAHGDAGEETTLAWLTWMAETVLPAYKAGTSITKPGDDGDNAPVTIAAREYAQDEYDSKLYGQNLKVRSKNKTDADVEPIVSIAGERSVHLLTGAIYGKDGKTLVDGAPAMPEAERVARINAATGYLVGAGKKVPGAYQSGINGLVDTGRWVMDGITLVATKPGNGKPGKK